MTVAAPVGLMSTSVQGPKKPSVPEIQPPMPVAVVLLYPMNRVNPAVCAVLTAMSVTVLKTRSVVEIHLTTVAVVVLNWMLSLHQPAVPVIPVSGSVVLTWSRSSALAITAKIR